MTRTRVSLLILCGCVLPFLARAQPHPNVLIDKQTTNSIIEFDPHTRNAWATNGVILSDQNTVLTADSATLDSETGEAAADGHVRIQQGTEIWVGEHMRYDFVKHQVVAREFRTGRSPVFMEGHGLHLDVTNHVYNATNAFVTTDDIDRPGTMLRASRIRIIPNEKVQMWNAVLYLGPVPVFYFPYYERNLGPRANNFNFTPGYRGAFGPFLLSDYTWFFGQHLDGKIHVDYRERRGIGVGPDVDFNLGPWGKGTVRYYYAHDEDPQTNLLGGPVFENRQRVYFNYQANPATNFTLKSIVRYQNDIGVVHDFFESEYRQNPQPDTFVEANKFWRNFSLDVLTRPRINDFYETVERLPDVRLTGFRQQLGPTPFYYESESSAGYYRRMFGVTNAALIDTNTFVPGTNYYAARADTYQQITMPFTLFGWLNFIPRAGGRFTYYGEGGGPGATTDEQYRRTWNAGGEVTFKASRLWPDTRSTALDLDGMRHIIQPSFNYIYVPTPNVRPNAIPQFDHELASLRMLPLEFPEYNSIDSIDSENVLRFGLLNKLQTKRAGQLDDFLNWQLFTDWRLHPRTNQQTFGDVYSDLTIKPRSWLSLESQIRYGINDTRWNMLLHTLTIQPNDVWSWSLGHFYLRDNFNTNSATPAWGQGNNLITSSFFYRVNENWGLRLSHHFDLRTGRMQEQYYTIYRDLRSWTAAVSAGLRDNGTGSKDFLISFTFSIKARPKYSLGGDTVEPYALLGR
jgi:LPS-assembly protein